MDYLFIAVRISNSKESSEEHVLQMKLQPHFTSKSTRKVMLQMFFSERNLKAQYQPNFTQKSTRKEMFERSSN